MLENKIKIVWFIDGKLGDCILSCSSLLRLNLSLYEITIITSRQNCNLIKNLKFPFKTRTLSVPFMRFMSKPNISRLRNLNLFLKNKERYEISINSFRWNSGSYIEQIFIGGNKLLNKFNLKGKVNFSLHETEIHEQFFNLASLDFNYNSKINDYLNLDADKFSDIIFHPFSSENSRCLSINLIKEIIKIFSGRHIKIIGLPSDNQLLIKQLKEIKTDNLTLDIKKRTYQDLVRLIRSSKLVLASESFVGHISSIMNIKTIGFYSRLSDPNQWYLKGPNSITIRSQSSCDDCLISSSEYHDCLRFDNKKTVLKQEVSRFEDILMNF